MDEEKHKERHIMLHKYLDELIADMISHTTMLPGKTTVGELMDWSYKQTNNPEEIRGI